jgi:hypothetical protein
LLVATQRAASTAPAAPPKTTTTATIDHIRRRFERSRREAADPGATVASGGFLVRRPIPTPSSKTAQPKRAQTLIDIAAARHELVAHTRTFGRSSRRPLLCQQAAANAANLGVRLPPRAPGGCLRDSPRSRRSCARSLRQRRRTSRVCLARFPAQLESRPSEATRARGLR